MKKKTLLRLLLSAAAVAACFLPSKAQVTTSRNANAALRDMYSMLRLSVVDSLTSEPVSFATVYLMPVKDTIITAFSLTDQKGETSFRDVIKGGYVINVEYLGYKPYRKTVYLRDRFVRMDPLKMQPDPQQLNAATVTDFVEPVVFKQDTIEYNAASYKVGKNAVLADLLRKMPGIEVTDEGKVTVNGESVKRITVEGRTFFFDDTQMSLYNLPAKIINKVRVIDKDTDQAKFTGIAEKESEKVMDLELKQQYKRGWFGNATLAAGAPIHSGEYDALTDDRDVLARLNALVAIYNSTDQLSVIGDLANTNATATGQSRVRGGRGARRDASSQADGSPRMGSIGVNFNTLRIKDMESAATLTLSSNGKDNMSRSARTTFQDDGDDLFTGAFNKSSSDALKVSLEGEIKPKSFDAKRYITVAPSISFTHGKSSSSQVDSSFYGAVKANSSNSFSMSRSNSVNAALRAGYGLRNLGKERRSVMINAGVNLSAGDSRNKDWTNTIYGDPSKDPLLKDLYYKGNSHGIGVSASVNYVEPISSKWSLNATLNGSASVSGNDKDAFEYDGTHGLVKSFDDENGYTKASDYYSSSYWSRSTVGGGRLLAQWGDFTKFLQMGVSSSMSRNEIKTTSYGVTDMPGSDDWVFSVSPFVMFRWSFADNSSRRSGGNGQNMGRRRMRGPGLMLSYRANSSQPSPTSMSSILNISNPTRITTGNVYLKPSLSNNFQANYNLGGFQARYQLRIGLSGSMVSDKQVSAMWMDKNGITYSVPVNAESPDYSGRMNVFFGYSFGSHKQMNLNAFLNGGLSRQISYRRSSGAPSLIDTESFEYTSFMADFWGDSSGSRFYGGDSGFLRQTTSGSNAGLRLTFMYKLTDLSLSLTTGNTYTGARYSSGNTSDRNTWDHRIMGRADYTPGTDWTFTTDAEFRGYSGYADGFGENEIAWNFGMSRSIKAFVLSLRVNDILGMTNNLSRNVTSTYTEDVYRNILGRSFMVGVTFNFGKQKMLRSADRVGSSDAM